VASADLRLGRILAEGEFLDRDRQRL